MTLNQLDFDKIVNEGYQILHDQDYNEETLANLFKNVGECEKPGLFMNSKVAPEIFYVTGEKDKDGNKIGMFGDGELGWHSNGNSRHLIDKILIALYCVKGDPNTTLSVCNTSRPYYDLPPAEQAYFEDIKIKLQFQNNTMYHLEEDDPELEFMSKNRGSIRPLVGTHPHSNLKYFYFPYHFITKAWKGKKQIDHNELIERLKKIVFKSRYQIHHVFGEGDLLLMDQFITLHRRTPVMGDRLLYRVACDYSKVYET